MECTQIITILYSSRARHAEGRQIERANGSRGDAVWSNLVREAWWLRERQGGEMEFLILAIKERDIPFHLSVGEHLRYVQEDRCSAERMMEVTAAPGYIEMTVCRKRPIPLCVVSARKGTAFVVGLYRALTPDVSVSHRMRNSCCGVGMVWPG